MGAHVIAGYAPRRIADALGGPVRAPRLAVLLLGGEVIELWPFLESFARLAGSPDRSLAAPAARAARDLAVQLVAGQAERWDVPRSELLAAYRQCVDVSARPGAWPDVRGNAAACALTLGQALDAPEDRLRQLVTAPLRASPDPEVRLQAVGLVGPAVSDARRALLSELAADKDDTVAAAALSALCLTRTPLPAPLARRAAALATTETDPGLRAPLRRCR